MSIFSRRNSASNYDIGDQQAELVFIKVYHNFKVLKGT